MDKTEKQFNDAVAKCRAIFEQKTADYGTSWRILRPSSLTDQIMIKAQRIRNLEQGGENLVGDSISSEYEGIVNYAVMALIQLRVGFAEESDFNLAQALAEYDHETSASLNLMLKKNHDYGEAWRDMRVSSFTDLILTKLLRIKQIEDNQGQTQVSEGIDANYQDIFNYAVFALIQLGEG